MKARPPAESLDKPSPKALPLVLRGVIFSFVARSGAVPYRAPRRPTVR